MNPKRYKMIAAEYGFSDMFSYSAEAFSRSIGFLDAADLELLNRSRVAVPGLGGVGSAHVSTLARLGFGAFNLADMDVYNPVNMNRQQGAKVTNWGKPKLDTVAEEALAISPFADVRLFSDGLTLENIDSFLDGVDVVVDALDFFVFNMRRALFNRARELGIPVITAAPLGFSSALLVFTPNGMGFDEYFDVNQETPMEKKLLHFMLGLAPAGLHAAYMDSSAVDFKMKKGPSLMVGCQMSAALAGTEAVRLVLNRSGIKAAQYYIQIDPYRKRMAKGRLRKGNRSPGQRFKAWVFERFVLAKSGRIGCFPQSPPSSHCFGVPLDATRVKFLLHAAIQAPSGDNVQPWKFKVDANAIAVNVDYSADTSFFNVHQLATIISAGAATENMRIAANACGLTCCVAQGKDIDAGELALLHFTCAKNFKEDVLADSIWRRHTNRKPYAKRKVPAGVWSYMRSEAHSIGDVRLEWVNSDQELKQLAKAIFWADRIRAERQDLHEHFMGMVRFTNHEILQTCDGLPLMNLEAGFAGNIFLKKTRSWKSMRIANALGVGRMVPLASSLGIRNCGGVGLLSVPTKSADDFFMGGRALERVWLSATHLNMRMQPMTAITLFQLRDMFGENEMFSQAHRRLLHNALDVLARLFPETSLRAPVMLFRVGFGRPIRYGTFRRVVESFV